MASDLLSVLAQRQAQREQLEEQQRQRKWKEGQAWPDFGRKLLGAGLGGLMGLGTQRLGEAWLPSKKAELEKAIAETVAAKLLADKRQQEIDAGKIKAEEDKRKRDVRSAMLGSFEPQMREMQPGFDKAKQRLVSESIRLMPVDRVLDTPTETLAKQSMDKYGREIIKTADQKIKAQQAAAAKAERSEVRETMKTLASFNKVMRSNGLKVIKPADMRKAVNPLSWVVKKTGGGRGRGAPKWVPDSKITKDMYALSQATADAAYMNPKGIIDPVTKKRVYGQHARLAVVNHLGLSRYKAANEARLAMAANIRKTLATNATSTANSIRTTNAKLKELKHKKDTATDKKAKDAADREIKKSEVNLEKQKLALEKIKEQRRQLEGQQKKVVTKRDPLSGLEETKTIKPKPTPKQQKKWQALVEQLKALGVDLPVEPAKPPAKAKPSAAKMKKVAAEIKADPKFKNEKPAVQAKELRRRLGL